MKKTLLPMFGLLALLIAIIFLVDYLGSPFELVPITPSPALVPTASPSAIPSSALN